MKETFAPGIGIDLVEVDRFRSALEKGGATFLNRLFTPSEQEDCASRADPPIHYAARWAAKEAAMKALGSGFAQDGVEFTHFEIRSDGSSPPQILLHKKAAELASERGLRSLRLSLSHTSTTAAAVVMAQA
ncbi:MAG TPA: holo-ACP synthase [Planctomycetota bacterium]|jgi:holo-[acyl-carrier protein] synthase|nr:holo-ACP synthase [Planctomycetota bacterium]MDP7245859.1 holo-ACP synthase [Planctomycetota bacterium]HJM39332.1 holo-ACP synthase [Planctomycetota bacterium]|tara:strand:- start:29009 stop:29401 length:393 start_codon:yes stop_codon:yes gene_type:complete